MHFDKLTGLYVTDATDLIVALPVPSGYSQDAARPTQSTQEAVTPEASAASAVAATIGDTVAAPTPAAPADGPTDGDVSYSIYSDGMLTLWEYAAEEWMPLYDFPPLPGSTPTTPSVPSPPATTPTVPTTTITLSAGYDNSGAITAMPYNWYFLDGRSLAQTYTAERPMITNSGTLEAFAAGSSLSVWGTSLYGSQYVTIDNSGGSIIANGGTVEIGPSIRGGTILAENGGELILGGQVSADTARVTNATLEFVNDTKGTVGPSGGITSSITLSGDCDKIQVSPTALNGMSVSFNDMTNDLTVSWFQFSTERRWSLHLSGSYSQSDFSLAGGAVIYMPHGAT